MATTTRSPRSQRWDLFGRYRVYVGGKLFIDRRRIVQTPWFAILFSRIHAADVGRDPHNHFRPFATFILSGSYDETLWNLPQRTAAGSRHHRRFSLRYLSRGKAHVITRITHPLRTLVVAGPHHPTFHFWTEFGPVDYKEYH